MTTALASRPGERTPPASLEAERRVLGAALVYPGPLPPWLRPQDFFDPLHREVMEAIGAQRAAGRQVEPMAIAERLRAGGSSASRSEAHAFLARLLPDACVPDLCSHFAGIVKRHALAREAIGLAGELQARLFGGSEPESVFAEARQHFEVLGTRARSMDPSAMTVLLSDVDPEEPEWLWEQRIPLRKLLVFDGDSGLGKSTMVADLCGRVTTGRPLPGEEVRREPRNVLLISHEDGLADTLRPRMDAAGADARRVRVWSASSIPSLPRDVRAIEREIRDAGAVMVVLDPIYAYLGDEHDSYKDSEVRRALTPLACMAEETGAAVVLIRHLRKSGGVAALHRGGGSVAVMALARAGLMLLRDPDDQAARILAWTKNSLGPAPSSLRWRFEGTGLNRPPRISWEGPCDLSADDVLARQERREDDGERSALDVATEFLRDLVDSEGGSVRVRAAKKAARDAGVTERTLERARAALGLKVRRLGFAADYVWETMPATSRDTASKPEMGGPGGSNVLEFQADLPPDHARQGHARQGELADLAGAGGEEELIPVIPLGDEP